MADVARVSGLFSKLLGFSCPPKTALLVLLAAAAGAGGVASESGPAAFSLGRKDVDALEQLLPEYLLQHRVELGMLALHDPGALEEVLGRHGEKLGFVGEGVRVDIRVAAFDLGHLASHQIEPRVDRLAIEPNTGQAIDGAV